MKTLTFGNDTLSINGFVMRISKIDYFHSVYEGKYGHGHKYTLRVSINSMEHALLSKHYDDDVDAEAIMKRKDVFHKECMEEIGNLTEEHTDNREI